MSQAEVAEPVTDNEDVGFIDRASLFESGGIGSVQQRSLYEKVGGRSLRGM